MKVGNAEPQPAQSPLRVAFLPDALICAACAIVSPATWVTRLLGGSWMRK